VRRHFSRQVAQLFRRKFRPVSLRSEHPIEPVRSLTCSQQPAILPYFRDTYKERNSIPGEERVFLLVNDTCFPSVTSSTSLLPIYLIVRCHNSESCSVHPLKIPLNVPEIRKYECRNKGWREGIGPLGARLLGPYTLHTFLLLFHSDFCNEILFRIISGPYCDH
jgi:hypothetical protein